MSEEKKEVKAEEIKDYESHWKRYYEGLADERRKEISKLAKLDKFVIPLYDEEADKWTEKEFVYKEIPTSKWLELEDDRARYADIQKIGASMLVNNKDEEYDYTQKGNALMVSIYKKSGKYFLGMTEQEFDNSSWVKTKNAIDACNHRTLFTLPN